MPTFKDATPKELVYYLDLAKKRKENLSAEYNVAQLDYSRALCTNTSIERRTELHRKVDSLKAEFDKIVGYISQIEARLSGANIPPKIGVNIETNTNPSTTVKNASTATTGSVRAASESDLKTGSTGKINRRADKILNLLKVQITPSTECVEPNDAIIKAIFSQSKTKLNVKEKHKTKKKPAFVSNINVQSIDNNPLDEFDRAVLGVIISEYTVGNHYTTVNIIHRALIGRPGQGVKGFYPHKDQETAIINSIKKLMGTVVDFSGVNENLKKLKYTDKEGNELSLVADNLLSAGILNAKVNGQPTDGVIYFKDNCPLFQIADAKDQVIRYPHELLNVPKLRNTPLVISLKKYVMRRICEIKLHKQLAPTITFDDVFSKCKVNNSDKSKRQDARNVIIKLFKYLKTQNFITDCEVRKSGKKFTGVTFKFDFQEQVH